MCSRTRVNNTQYIKIELARRTSAPRAMTVKRFVTWERISLCL
jgi:hypothetical protein